MVTFADSGVHPQSDYLSDYHALALKLDNPTTWQSVAASESHLAVTSAPPLNSNAHHTTCGTACPSKGIRSRRRTARLLHALIQSNSVASKLAVWHIALVIICLYCYTSAGFPFEHYGFRLGPPKRARHGAAGECPCLAGGLSYASVSPCNTSAQHRVSLLCEA